MTKQTFSFLSKRNYYLTITLVELARAAAVFVSTVSRALSNGKYPLKKATRQKILKLAEEMGYKPNLVARGLQSSRSHLVGVIVDRMQSPFAAATIQGIQDGLRHARYSISIAYSNRDQDIAAQAISSFYSHQVDGIIILNSWLHTYNDPILSLQDRLFVFVNRVFGNRIQNCVGPGDRQGARLATQHLVELGHRRIGYINGMENWIEAQNRLAGYRDVLMEHGLPVDEALIRHGNWVLTAGMKLLGNCWLSKKGRQLFLPLTISWLWAQFMRFKRLGYKSPRMLLSLDMTIVILPPGLDQR